MSKKSRRHSRYVSSRTGRIRSATPPRAESAARLRCCQSGARMPGRRFGSNSDRAAFSRNSPQTTPSRQLPDDQRLHLVGIGRRRRGSGGSSTSGNRDWSPSSPTAPRRRCRAPDGSGGRRRGPRRVDAPAARREHAGRRFANSSRTRSTRTVPGVGNRARDFDRAVLERDVRRPARQIVVADQRRSTAAPAGRRNKIVRAGRSRAELQRTPCAVALPERHLARLARGG